MSQQFIVEIISCLDAYIKKLSPSEKAEIVKNSHDLEEGTLLSLLASSLQEEEGKELTEGDILEIVFKCKLFSLNRPQKGLKEEDKISKFFHDIYQLIGEKGRSSTEINRLA